MPGSHNYPRSLPYRPPDSPVTPPTPPAGRSVLFLVGFCALFLAIGLTLGALFLQRPAQGQTGTPVAAAPVPTRPAEKPAPPTQPEPRPAPREEKPRPAPAKEPSAPARHSELILEALGTLTAANLYQTHLNIGLLADALEVDLYELVQAQEMLQVLSGLLAASDKQLETLAGQPLDPEDKKGLERARQIHSLLREQIQELQAYWKSSDKEAATRFHKAREKSWVAVKAMLNLKD